MATRAKLPSSMGAAAHVAERVREHRAALGLSQEELARACHVSRQTISNWETALLAASVLAVAAGLLVLGDALPLAPEPDIGTRLQNQMALAHPHWFIEQTDPFGYLMLVLGIEVVAVVWAAFFDRRRRKRAAHR